jgi:hypothetical protein
MRATDAKALQAARVRWPWWAAAAFLALAGTAATLLACSSVSVGLAFRFRQAGPPSKHLGAPVRADL